MVKVYQKGHKLGKGAKGKKNQLFQKKKIGGRITNKWKNGRSLVMD